MNAECAICLETDPLKVKFVPACGHSIHARCLGAYLASNRYSLESGRCPECRRQLDDYDLQQLTELIHEKPPVRAFCCGEDMDSINGVIRIFQCRKCMMLTYEDWKEFRFQGQWPTCEHHGGALQVKRVRYHGPTCTVRRDFVCYASDGQASCSTWPMQYCWTIDDTDDFDEFPILGPPEPPSDDDIPLGQPSPSDPVVDMEDDMAGNAEVANDCEMDLTEEYNMLIDMFHGTPADDLLAVFPEWQH